MHKLTRRTILSAALPALALASGAEAVSSPSPLADLIREYRALRTAYDNADEADALANFTPKVTLWAPPANGRPTMQKEPTLGHSHQAIDDYFDRLAGIAIGHDYRPERAAKHAEFAALKSSPENQRAVRCADLANALYDRLAEARQRVFAHRPQNMAELGKKNAFLQEILAQGFDFGESELAAIFGRGKTVFA